MKQLTPLSPDTVYATIGVKRNVGEDAMEYLYRVVQADSISRTAADYFLCGLLLEKRLTDFVDYLPRFYNFAQGDSLPRHYKEALIYYATVMSDIELPFDSEAMRAGLITMGLMNWQYGDELPKHYIDAFRDFAIPTEKMAKLFDLESLGKEFAAMLELERQHPEIQIRSNYIRKNFGHTYWWYYAYSD